MIETIKRIDGIADRTEKEFNALMRAAEQLGKQTQLSCNEVHVASKALAEPGVVLTDPKDYMRPIDQVIREIEDSLSKLTDSQKDHHADKLRQHGGVQLDMVVFDEIHQWK